MAYAKKQYFIRLANGQKHRLRGDRFREWIDRKFAYVVGERIANLAPDVTLYLVDGELQPFLPNDLQGKSIPSSWRLVEGARVYHQRGIREAGERTRAIQEMCGPQSIKNEICYPDLESFGTLVPDPPSSAISSSAHPS